MSHFDRSFVDSSSGGSGSGSGSGTSCGSGGSYGGRSSQVSDVSWSAH